MFPNSRLTLDILRDEVLPPLAVHPRYSDFPDILSSALALGHKVRPINHRAVNTQSCRQQTGTREMHIV
jgi:hypothetical protein